MSKGASHLGSIHSFPRAESALPFRFQGVADSLWQHLEAQVSDDQQTLWWLMAMGANVEVLSPENWKKEIFDSAKEILARMENKDMKKTANSK
ncbi:WYL domain-containing protein [Halomonas sediminis]